MATLRKAESFLPQVPEKEELDAVFHQLEFAIQHYVKNQHKEWFESVEPTLATRLENNLIVMGEGNLLHVNFDKIILRHFNEIHYFERLSLDIPYVAMEVSSHREKFRVLR